MDALKRSYDQVVHVSTLTEESLKDVDKKDHPLFQKLWAIINEIAHKAKVIVTDEPPMEHGITLFPDKHMYQLWVLYSPSVTVINALTLSCIVALGQTYDERIGWQDIEQGIEGNRIFLRINILHVSATERRKVTNKLLIQTIVEFHPIGAIASEPDGLTVRRLSNHATLYSNNNSPRPNKRARMDI
jgi:hypothetical protein